MLDRPPPQSRPPPEEFPQAGKFLSDRPAAGASNLPARGNLTDRPQPARPKKSPGPRLLSPPGARSKRYRARQRNGRIVPSMPDIGADEISFLIQTRWLREENAGDRAAIGAAIAALIKDAAKRG
jgi:hypothetical protein